MLLIFGRFVTFVRLDCCDCYHVFIRGQKREPSVSTCLASVCPSPQLHLRLLDSQFIRQMHVQLGDARGFEMLVRYESRCLFITCYNIHLQEGFERCDRRCLKRDILHLYPEPGSVTPKVTPMALRKTLLLYGVADPTGSEPTAPEGLHLSRSQ